MRAGFSMASLVNASTPLAALDCVVLDTETTGLDARTARLVQIGAVSISSGRILPDRRFDQLVNPGVAIPAATTAVHGISDHHVADAPRFDAVARQLIDFIGDSVLVGHTLNYDLTILQRETEASNMRWEAPRTLDIRALAEVARPSLAQYDLDRLAELYGVEIKGRHTACGDAEATARIFLALLPALRERGVRTLAEAEAACRDLSDRQASAGRLTATVGAASQPSRTLLRIDSFPYRHRLADVMSAPPVWCEGTALLSEVMRVLIDRKISSVLVRDEALGPGILTERDLLRAIDRGGAEPFAQRASAVASRPLQTLPAAAFVYRAIGRISRLGIRHLAVTAADGSIAGMVTTRNLLRHRASTALALGDGVDVASSPGALARIWADLTPMAESLLSEDVDARDVASVISEEVCALTRRAAELAEAAMEAEGHGKPPVAYAVLVLGSAGRGESLLAADQDNAIVFARGEPGGAEDRWFEQLARRMTAILDEVGVPFCKGGVMASNALWRHSVEGWHELVGRWIRRQRPEDLLNVDIFFDGITVHGDEALGEGIMSYAFDNARRAPDFLLQLALMAPKSSPPISWLGKIKTNEEGRVDLKLHGLMPIFTAARVSAIREGRRARSTPDRLRAVAGSVGADADSVERLIDAHGTILAAMLKQQLDDSRAGIRLSPRVHVGSLTEAERGHIKGALQRVPIAQDILQEGRL